MALYDDVREAARRYETVGIDTMPLEPGSKKTFTRNWPLLPPNILWQSAKVDSNIGIRCGGLARILVIDCDEDDCPGTVEKVQEYLAAINLKEGDYPFIKTASGIGRHIFLSLDDTIGGDAFHLSPEFGSGEVRFGSGSYVVAAPSRLSNGSNYEMVSGSLDLIPKICYEDIFPLINNQQKMSVTQSVGTTVSSKIPRNAVSLLWGRGIEKYRSRSEAEQALILMLVNGHNDYERILKIFKKYPCAGKFNDIFKTSPARAKTWLRRSYEDAEKYATSHDSDERIAAAALIDWAEEKEWKGRSAQYNKLVYLEYAKIAFLAGKLTISASVRRVADGANINTMTVSRATHRLIDAGYLELIRKGEADYASTYRLIEVCKNDTHPHIGELGMCIDFATISHDVFRGGSGLGKTAGEIWETLKKGGPMNIQDLSKKTGRDKRTILTALKKMLEIIDDLTGEVISMVEVKSDMWHTCQIDLDHIAYVIGSAGVGERQRRRHKAEQQERRNWWNEQNMGKKV